MARHYDVVIIGAGPAGMAAAAFLGRTGMDVLVLDEQARPGGQIYKNIEGADADQLNLFGTDYRDGLKLAENFRKADVTYENQALVWQVETEGWVSYSRAGASKRVRANYIIAATGAMERPMPIPGWTLPGVMGAGAVNNLAKEANLAPEGPVVLAGSGPLLLLEASLLLKKGVAIAAILETGDSLPPVKAIPKLPPALLRWDFLQKGVSMLHEIRTSRVPHYKGITRLRALGRDVLEGVSARAGGKTLNFETQTLLLHFGVIPNTHIFRQMGCRMAWQEDQRYWYPVGDTWGRTNFERIFAAGDGSGVQGGVAAQYKGQLAALEIAACSGMISTEERDRLADPIRRALAHDGLPRPFVDAMYAPRETDFLFEPETVICRCENVTVAQVRQAVDEGVRDLNELKILTRCGMGPCQGRMCGPALAEILGQELSLAPDRVGQLSVRPPITPLPLGEIAAMDLGDNDAPAGNWLLDKKK